MTKFQEELRQAIYDVYRAKPVCNNEDVKLWKEQYKLANERLEKLIERAVDSNDDIVQIGQRELNKCISLGKRWESL
jgi:hypothetical protein